MTAPRLQSLVLFEVYEGSGDLLLVTSDATDIRLQPGDVVYRREWMTCSTPHEHNRVRA